MTISLEHVSDDPQDRDNMARIARNFQALEGAILLLGASVTIGHGAPGAGVVPGLYIDQDTSPPGVYVIT